MRTTLLAVMLSFLVMAQAFGQQMSAPDQEMMRIRQSMTEQYAAAVAKKDAVAMADHYTVDAVTASLCPETPPLLAARRRQSASKRR